MWHTETFWYVTPEIQTDIQGWVRLDPLRPDKTVECRNESERSAAHRGNQCYQTHQCDLTTDNSHVYNQQNALMTLQKCNMTVEFEIDILIYNYVTIWVKAEARDTCFIRSESLGVKVEFRPPYQVSKKPMTSHPRSTFG